MRRRANKRQKRKICVVTGSRADYGLLYWTLHMLRADAGVELQLCVTGMHLSPEFGSTIKEIIADGFSIRKRIDSKLLSDTPKGIGDSIAQGISGFAKAFAELEPDILLVVGDRFEVFAAVAAAVAFRIPVAHCHGGEMTVGAMDEALRHSITKMSHLHFVATPQYRKRVIQLGELPQRVFVSGALSLDNIRKLPLLNSRALSRELDLSFRSKTVVVTFHPVTLEKDSAAEQFTQVLSALKTLKDTSIIITKPNADTGGRVLIKMIDDFVSSHPNAAAFTSLGTLRYLSLLKHADIVLGNSSSGIIEAPSLRTATVNIGDRQKGRIRAASVIDAEPKTKSILAAIQKCSNRSFQKRLKTVSNPYDQGSACACIVRKLKQAPLTNLVKKQFFDLPGADRAIR